MNATKHTNTISVCMCVSIPGPDTRVVFLVPAPLTDISYAKMRGSIKIQASAQFYGHPPNPEPFIPTCTPMPTFNEHRKYVQFKFETRREMGVKTHKDTYTKNEMRRDGEGRGGAGRGGAG